MLLTGTLGGLGVIGLLVMWFGALNIWLIDRDLRLSAILLAAGLGMGFMGWLFGGAARSFWRERKRRDGLYIAITPHDLIYQFYDIILSDDLRRVVIPRARIFRLDFVTYPGGADSPATEMIQVWYRQPDGQNEVLEIPYFFADTPKDLYRTLKEALNL